MLSSLRHNVVFDHFITATSGNDISNIQVFYVKSRQSRYEQHIFMQCDFQRLVNLTLGTCNGSVRSAARLRLYKVGNHIGRSPLTQASMFYLMSLANDLFLIYFECVLLFRYSIVTPYIVHLFGETFTSTGVTLSSSNRWFGCDVSSVGLLSVHGVYNGNPNDCRSTLRKYNRRKDCWSLQP